jgi:hypothetical protein
MNIYDALRESHERQRSLCRKLLRSRPHDERRIDLFHELRTELAAHEAAEERCLYVPMLMDDRGLDASRHALHEHHEIDELIEKMREGRPGDRGWMNTAKALSRQIHHHLREEETKFFQMAGKILTATQKQRLARQYLAQFGRLQRKFETERD